MSNRNITLSLPDELVRKAKVLAAQRDTSVSALVCGLLEQAVGQVEDYDSVWAAEEQAMAAGLLEVGPITWTRESVHER
jgi:hypothetical protein